MDSILESELHVLAGDLRLLRRLLGLESVIVDMSFLGI